MSKSIQNRFRIMALVIFMLILITASYGFAATNTIADAGLAGEGSNTVSGYTVTLVNYVLDSGDPTQLDSVLFTLSSSAASVYAGIDTVPTSGIDWSAACTDLGSNRFDCDLSGVAYTVEEAAMLHVAAGQ